MSRGGYREKAGRKSGWVNTQTTTIRVPEIFASQLLSIAKKLDSGDNLDLDSNLRTVSLDQVKDAFQSVVLDNQVTRNGRDRGRVRHGLNAFINQLFGEAFRVETKSKPDSQ